MKLFLQLQGEDAPHLPYLKPILGGHQVRFNASKVSTITEVVMRAEEFGAKQVVSTSPHLLQKLLFASSTSEKLPTVDDYAGSIIKHASSGIEFLFINPLEHIHTITYGSFLLRRYLTKFTVPDSWFPSPVVSYEVARPENLNAIYAKFSTATYISVDIETQRDGLAITCAGYCGVWINSISNTASYHAVVIPCRDDFYLTWIGKFNALPAPKIMQNGKYDNAYFARWGVPVYNWKWDTITLFHSWQSELPKRLDFITSFTLRDWQYWKNESNVHIHSTEYYRYNAKDCIGTAFAFLSLISEMPSWAFTNYLIEFPKVFPCHQAELTGIAKHSTNFDKVTEQVKLSEQKITTELQASCGDKRFNPGSSKQCVRLWKVLGSGDVTSSDPPARDKVKFRHPLNAYFVDLIEDVRKDRKLISSYLKEEMTLDNRFLYQLNPHGTTTGRLASAEHHYWCGLQIQNIPARRTDIRYKSVFQADPGFLFGEGDFEQAESRDTAYLSGDPKLIEAVESTRDFHSLNAAAFFGVAYELIYDDAVKKAVDTVLRDLSKRTNHGANYNMGAKIMLNTMGIKNVLRARDLLGLPKSWSLLDVTQYLLDQFSKTYSVVKGQWYDYVKYQVETHKLLVGPTGWTRYCFGHPAKSKRDLNAYVAHPPQSLNALTLNEAWWQVFVEVALKEPTDFKLCAQIHDSILFQYRVGRIDLLHKVAKLMVFPVQVVDCGGISRQLIVPVAMKGESNIWSEIKKIPTTAHNKVEIAA